MTPRRNRNLQVNRPADARSDGGVRERQLLDHLRTLPFAALMGCVANLLAAEGYANIRLSSRVGYRGRNKEGGYDLEALLPSPLDAASQISGGVRKVIVQVKQFEEGTRVYLRALDALRGACLRTGAIEGVLITTSDFSPVVRNVETELRRHGGNAVAPVHLMNGATLAERFVRHGIGVRRLANGKSAIDPGYFASLLTSANIAGCRVSRSASKSVRAEVSMSSDQLTLMLPLSLLTRS